MYSKHIDKITAIQIWPGEGRAEVLPVNDGDLHVKLASTQAEFPKVAQRNRAPIWWKLF